MKTTRQNKIIIIALSIVAVITLGGLYYFGTRIGDSSKDAGTQQPNPLFSSKLGAYSLMTADAGLGDPECSNIKRHLDTKDLSLTGEICERSMGAEYKDPTSGHVVFVHLIRITENPDLYRKLLDKVSRADRLEPYSVIRLEGSEIGWFPASKEFDIIITQEGDLTPTGFDYALKAAGKNAVTEYFLATYPPATN